MNEKDLLRAMSDMDDEYVIEALEAPLEEKKPKKMNWKLWGSSIAAVLVLSIGIGTLGSGFMMMGSNSKFESAQSTAAVAAPEEYYDKEMAVSDSFAAGAGNANTALDMFTAVQEVKLVKRADLSIQTLVLKDSEEALSTLVKELGGYFESTSLNGGGYYNEDQFQSANFTIRIPEDQYDAFIEAIKESCHLSYLNESTEDISTEYYDTQGRLESLRAKQARLNELLSQAKDMSDIITIESAINETQYMIDSYTSTMNRYDKMVGYATIDINMYEVSRVDASAGQKVNFFTKLWRSFKSGLYNFVDSIGNLIYWAAYNVIGIAIVVVAILIIKKNHLVARLVEKIKGKKAA